MNILITAANSAEAQRLKNTFKTDKVILGDYFELPAFMLNDNLIRLPNPKSIAYAHEMLTLCLDKHIETVYLLREEEKQPLKETEQLFIEFNIKMVHGS